MNRTARAGLVAILAGVLVFSGVGMPAQADEPTPTEAPETTPPATPEPESKDAAGLAAAPVDNSAMTISLNHTKAFPGTPVVLTASFDPTTDADGGSVRVVASGKTKSSTVADHKAKVTLPALSIGKHKVTAYYRAEGATADSATKQTTVTITSARRVTIGINGGKNAAFARGEKFWVRGQVRSTYNKPVGRQKVTIYAYSGSKRKTLATVTSNASGTYFYSVRPGTTTRFRARRATLVSPQVKAQATTSVRTLEAREKELAFMLGKPNGWPVTTNSVTYRKYAHGTLIRAGSRTWLVRGEILKEYLRRDGVKGKLGAPRYDERCHLKEGACLQRFAHGSIYTNSHAKDRTTSVIAPGPNADLVATALSQVGYLEPSYRHSKYNKWMRRTGRGDAWCGYFAAWSSVASGHGSAVIKAKTFAGMVKAEKKRGRLTSKPAVGRLAYIDYSYKGRPTHVGIVLKYTGSYVWLVEGNVSAGGHGKQPRGVYIVKRKRSQIVKYANPRW